jgi:hypothetical protein
MTLRRIQVFAVAVLLSTLLLASGAAQPSGAVQPTGSKPVVRNAAARAKWTFWGCWTQFSAGTCRDIYRDEQGNFWICRACGTTGNPGPGKCSPISEATLASGFWCS